MTLSLRKSIMYFIIFIWIKLIDNKHKKKNLQGRQQRVKTNFEEDIENMSKNTISNNLFQEMPAIIYIYI